MILAGDFNAEPESDEMEILREHKDYVNLTEGIGSTYHGFSSEEQEESIDYIYVRNGGKDWFFLVLLWKSGRTEKGACGFQTTIRYVSVWSGINKTQVDIIQYRFLICL